MGPFFFSVTHVPCRVGKAFLMFLCPVQRPCSSNSFFYKFLMMMVFENGSLAVCSKPIKGPESFKWHCVAFQSVLCCFKKGRNCAPFLLSLYLILLYLVNYIICLLLCFLTCVCFLLFIIGTGKGKRNGSETSGLASEEKAFRCIHRIPKLCKIWIPKVWPW